MERVPLAPKCGTGGIALCHDAVVEVSRGAVEQGLVRVGDAERDACSAVLIDHHLHGRLSIDELEIRQRASLVAVTEEDLSRLLADLPGQQSATERRRSERLPREASRNVTPLALRLAPVVPVLGGAWFTEWLVQINSIAGTPGLGFAGAVATGAAAWATHAVIGRSRR